MDETTFMELVARAVGAAVAAVQGSQAGGGVGGGGGGRVMGKAFSDVKKFDKVVEEWDDWAFDFKTAVGMLNPDMRTVLEVIEGYPEDVDTTKTAAFDPARAERMGLRQRSAELYQVLILKTEGEAKLMVKAVADSDGVRAWQKLHRHYHRKTFAKAVRDHREVLYPRSLKMEEVVGGIMAWEDKVTKLEKTYEEIPAMLKMAALVEMIPNEIKDMVYMTMDEADQNYDKLRQKIVSWVSNKVTVPKGPTPMDIGRVHQEREHYEEQDELCIGAIGSNTTCYSCGG